MIYEKFIFTLKHFRVFMPGSAFSVCLEIKSYDHYLRLAFCDHVENGRYGCYETSTIKGDYILDQDDLRLLQYFEIKE